MFIFVQLFLFLGRNWHPVPGSVQATFLDQRSEGLLAIFKFTFIFKYTFVVVLFTRLNIYCYLQQIAMAILSYLFIELPSTVDSYILIYCHLEQIVMAILPYLYNYCVSTRWDIPLWHLTIFNCYLQQIAIFFYLYLKEYYEIVGESRPLSAFFPTHADFFTEMHFYS